MKALALVKEEHIPEKKEWEKDVASLDEDEIDRYLEFCETHLARNDHLDKGTIPCFFTSSKLTSHSR